MSGRTASMPLTSSNARSTASDMNAPPCTTTQRPSESSGSMPMMRNSAFFTTEYAMPAAMSSVSTPLFCAWRTRDVMNTVHFVPKSTGDSAKRAAAANR